MLRLLWVHHEGCQEDFGSIANHELIRGWAHVPMGQTNVNVII